MPLSALVEAAANPGGWVYELAPGWRKEQGVPPEAILGAWEIGDDGQPTGTYHPNPTYDATIAAAPPAWDNDANG